MIRYDLWVLLNQYVRCDRFVQLILYDRLDQYDRFVRFVLSVL